MTQRNRFEACRSSEEVNLRLVTVLETVLTDPAVTLDDVRAIVGQATARRDAILDELIAWARSVAPSSHVAKATRGGGNG